MEVIKREERICFRTSRARLREIQALAGVTQLPRSAVVFLLVSYALEHLSPCDGQATWWSAMLVVPPAEQQAALLREMGS